MHPTALENNFFLTKLVSYHITDVTDLDYVREEGND